MGNEISRQKKELCEAVEKGDIQSVTRLLEMQVDINTRNEDGTTILTKACWKKNKEMVEFLLAKSVDVNGTDWLGWTALIVCAVIGSEEITDLLLNVKDINVMKGERVGRTAIHHAAMNNHVAIVERLLSRSVPVDINDNGGRTPLWYAACTGRVHCVDVLLKHGASPQHESKSDGSPLEIAKKEGDSDVVEMMEEAIRLRSHVYVEGDVSIMRHQYEETIAELQSEVEKKTEELRQSSLVHESEVRMLRNEIQQKEKEIRRLRMSAADRAGEDQVASEAWLLTQPPELIMLAVSILACDRWSDVGLALDYTMAFLIAHTASIAEPCSKLHAILRTKAESVGTSNVVGIILSACQQISMPICAAAIRDEVARRQVRLKTQNGGQ